MTGRRWRTAAVAVGVLVVVAAVVLVVVRVVGGDDEPSRFDRAVSYAPPNAQRVLWTDWSGVRDELGLDLGDDPSDDQVQQLLDRGFETDLTATTALVSSAVTMQESLGFSPATLDWELFAQSESGAALVMKLGGGVTTDDVADRLRALDYTPPTGDDGFWALSSDRAFSGSVTPELSFVTFVDGLVVAGDTPAGPREARASVREASSQPVPAGVLAGLGQPITAVLYTADQVCSALALAQADDSERAVGEQLVAQAGAVDPLTGFGMGAERGGQVRVTMGFETDDAARTNADTRSKLAAGAAPGQGGDFADRFTLGPVRADGTTVTFELEPVEGAFVVSDLSTGPLLFATC